MSQEKRNQEKHGHGMSPLGKAAVLETSRQYFNRDYGVDEHQEFLGVGATILPDLEVQHAVLA